MTEMNQTPAQAVVWTCADCIPAGSTAERYDDKRGRCQGCGKSDGNLRRCPVAPLVITRGSWATATGLLVGPSTRKA